MRYRLLRRGLDQIQRKKILVERRSFVSFRGLTVPIAAGQPSEQRVLDTSALSPKANEIADEIRQTSIAQGAEVAVWLFVARDGRQFRSRAVSSQAGNEVKGEDLNQASTETAAMLNKSPTTIGIYEVVLLHTRPTAHPLSTKDMVTLNETAAQLPTIATRIVALPVTDPSLMFLSSRPPERR